MTKTYFKAVRPDGTDFYTGSVDYAAHLLSGKPLKRKPAAADYRCCSGGVYHAADAAAETLIGGSWPCRLFEVTGKPVASEGHKFGFRSLRVVREIDAHLALGPNGAEAAALIERAGRLTAAEAEALYAALYAARYAALYAARYAALYAARHAAWDAAGNAAGNAAWDAAGNAAGDAARGAAWGAARGAAAALVVKDLITVEQFDVLYGPWASVATG